MTSHYRKFLQLCKNWPVDPSKPQGKDLAVLIREKVAEAFRHGDATTIRDLQACESIYDSLQRINSNVHKNKYVPSMTYETAACRATKEECSQVLSAEGMDAIHESDVSVLKKLKETVVKPEKE